MKDLYDGIMRKICSHISKLIGLDSKDDLT